MQATDCPSGRVKLLRQLVVAEQISEKVWGGGLRELDEDWCLETPSAFQYNKKGVDTQAMTLTKFNALRNGLDERQDIQTLFLEVDF